jgi:hypothetical protein
MESGAGDGSRTRDIEPEGFGLESLSVYAQWHPSWRPEHFVSSYRVASQAQNARGDRPARDPYSQQRPEAIRLVRAIQRQTAVSDKSRSWATAPTDLPPVRQSPSASALYASGNDRLGRFCCDMTTMINIPSRPLDRYRMSVKPGEDRQLHAPGQG